MLETSARLLRLLSLLQARQDWSGAELASRLEVDVRTVRRDVDRLRNLGYPVDASPGVAGGYRLGVGASLPPLLLDDEEAVAVAISLRTAAAGSVAGIEETSIQALTKLEHMLPSRLRHRVSALQAVVVHTPSYGPSVDAEVLATVAGACREHMRLRFDYRAHNGSASRRQVEPHSLVNIGRRWYVLGWDLDRTDWRTFRLDRLELKTPTGPRFQPRTPPADAATFVSKGVTGRAYKFEGKFLMHAPIDQVAEKVTPTAGRLEPVDDSSCILHAGADSLLGIAVFISMYGFEFEVLEPVEMVGYLRDHIARMQRAVARHDPA
ncbi:helix-turn-helix transcriptional regulator [Kutzneria sp. CA-103260]|uniref:helix-turn-helix transcriptional regulator n=1 Tax=Kutzneria sp. CA-103260 TaxID=2802641 RepID=UPI001BA7F540|nr:YafY family protein [Kutzneria sp. CA-103260]